MPKKNPVIERPCPDCNHLHDGIVCMETGCECKLKYRSENLPVPGHPEADRASIEAPQADDNAVDVSVAADSIVAQQPPATPIPLQERVANLLEDYKAETGRIEVGCELVIAGRCFAWDGQKFSEVAAASPEPQKPVVAVLSDEDKGKLREFFAEQGVEELPDGSVRLPIIVPAEMAVILREWAESSQESWPVYLQRTVEMGLNAIVNGGTVAGFEPAVK